MIKNVNSLMSLGHHLKFVLQRISRQDRSGRQTRMDGHFNYQTEEVCRSEILLDLKFHPK